MNQKFKILIVDDSEMNRSILRDILEPEYEIIEAANGLEAIEILEKNLSEISIVMLDLVMPKMDGLEVLKRMNDTNWISDIPVIMISAESDQSMIDQAYDMGITDYITRPFDFKTVQRRVKNTILLYTKQKKLVEIVADQIYQKEKSNSLMINILSHVVEFRNGESGLHIIHVRTATELLLKHLAKKYPELGLTQEKISLISMASALHDIGKIVIPDNILNKPGRLTPEEFDVMKQHSAAGSDILKEFNPDDDQLIKFAYEIARWHHERYDGRGYPDGLKGDDIPISAQVVAIADVYDALTSKRCYKDAFSHEKAVEMICNNECGVFNPMIIECMLEVSEQLKYALKDNSVSDAALNDIQHMTQNVLRSNDISVSVIPVHNK